MLGYKWESELAAAHLRGEAIGDFRSDFDKSGHSMEHEILSLIPKAEELALEAHALFVYLLVLPFANDQRN